MSKVVKAIGRGIKKIVSGVGKLVKKVSKSTIGKVILAAATVYFGGAALMGGVKGAAAGTGFLSGASAGLSGAASGISSAWGSLMGGNFSQAGSQLWSGFTGSGAAPAATPGIGLNPSGLMSTTGDPIASGGITGQMGSNELAAGYGGVTGVSPYDITTSYDLTTGATPSVGMTVPPSAMPSPGGGLVASAATPAATGSQSIFQQIMSSKYGAPALIQAGTQLAGGLISAYGQKQEQERQERLADEARQRYSTNVGYTAGWKTY